MPLYMVCILQETSTDKTQGEKSDRDLKISQKRKPTSFVATASFVSRTTTDLFFLVLYYNFSFCE